MTHFGKSVIGSMAVLATVVSVALAVDAPVAPAKVTNFGKMPLVTFNHATHKKNQECKSCHHRQDSNNYKCGGSGCHGSQAAGQAVAIKDAMHKNGKGKCWSCHFPAAPQPTKPLKCVECHKQS